MYRAAVAGIVRQRQNSGFVVAGSFVAPVSWAEPGSRISLGMKKPGRRRASLPVNPSRRLLAPSLGPLRRVGRPIGDGIPAGAAPGSSSAVPSMPLFPRVPFRGGLAFSRFAVGNRTPTVTISQDGQGRLWSSSLDVDPDGIYRTSVEGDLMDGWESAHYCWPDPESAVEAAILVWETFEGNEPGD